MKPSTIQIRPATVKDAAALLDIYAYYVENTAITFEYEVPSLAEFQERIEHTLMRYPYLVATDHGEILGYAYAGAFHVRAAYAHAAEMTVYVRHDCKKSGIGQALYEALTHCLTMQNVCNLYACIAKPAQDNDPYLNDNSIGFHTHMGYEIVGTFHQCGYKFQHWYHMVWMEKQILPHGENPPPFLPYPNASSASDKL